ncbi:hypothetical protein NL676_035715 [Syzygium grande]|nr:hypothetical protein NL676_035715 [Syzygium grande]
MITGKEAFVAKLTSVQCQYQISKIICIPHIPTCGAVTQVTGYMWIDGKQEARPGFDSLEFAAGQPRVLDLGSAGQAALTKVTQPRVRSTDAKFGSPVA